MNEIVQWSRFCFKKKFSPRILFGEIDILRVVNRVEIGFENGVQIFCRRE